MPAYDEPVDDRFKVRFSFGDSSQSPVSHGYSIKFTLIDEQNLLLYQNILELTYSSINRAVAGKNLRVPSSLRGKEAPQKTSWSEKTLQLMTRNFVEDASKIIGEEYRLPVRRALKKLNLKVEALIHSK